MIAPQERQRHGCRRGASVESRGTNATRTFYAGAALPAIPILPTKASGRRLPPFGRDVERAVAAGKSPNVYIYATPDAWERVRNRTRGTAMVLPPGEDPEAYRWPCVPGGVFICAPGAPRELALKLARAVVSCGSPLAFAVYGNAEALIVRTTAHAQTLGFVP